MQGRYTAAFWLPKCPDKFIRTGRTWCLAPQGLRRRTDNQNAQSSWSAVGAYIHFIQERYTSRLAGQVICFSGQTSHNNTYTQAKDMRAKYIALRTSCSPWTGGMHRTFEETTGPQIPPHSSRAPIFLWTCLYTSLTPKLPRGTYLLGQDTQDSRAVKATSHAIVPTPGKGIAQAAVAEAASRWQCCWHSWAHENKMQFPQNVILLFPETGRDPAALRKNHSSYPTGRQ